MTMRLISSNLLSSSRNLLGSTSSRIGCGLMPRVLPLVQIPIKFACASSLARSPHVSLEEKAMLVESLLRAKVIFSIRCTDTGGSHSLPDHEKPSLLLRIFVDSADALWSICYCSEN